MTQDKIGFMWFGTRYGLNRFDGYEFKTFTHNPDDSLSLSHNVITSICEDHEGHLWIGTDGGGVSRFDQIKEQFYNYRNSPDNSGSLSNDFITSLIVDSRGILWIGTQSGLNRFDSEQQLFTVYNTQSTTGLASDNITSLAEFPTGKLWIGTKDGYLTTLDLHEGQFSLVHPEELKPNVASNNYIAEMAGDYRSQTLWIAVFPIGIYRYDLNSNSLDKFRFETDTQNRASLNAPYSVMADSSGMVWIGSVIGLTRYDPALQKLDYFKPDDQNKYSLSDYVINCLYLDNQQSLWIGTDSKGINKYDPDLVRFKHIKWQADTPGGLSHNRVYTFDEDEVGNLWVGSVGGGLNLLPPGSSSFTHYQSDDSKRGVWSSNYIMKLVCGQDNLIWLATYGSGLFSFDPKTEEHQLFRHYLDDSTSISGNQIMSVYEDDQGYIWAGTNEHGLNRLDRETSQFTHYLHDPLDPTSISGNTIYAITQDSSGQLWIGTTDGGLNRYEPENDSFTRFQVEPGNASTISSNYIISLTVDSHNRLWIGTRGGGLNFLDPETEMVTRIGKEAGLPSDVVNGVLEDEEGYLWISTMYGISKYHPDHHSITNYTVEDGLLEGEFYYGSCLKSNSGKLFFGGNNGFNVFNPQEVQNNRYRPPLALTDVQINYNSLKPSVWKAPHLIQHLHLSYKDRVITFEFAALDYTVPLKNLYSYKLEGFDDDWISPGFNRQVTYTNLDPGSYTFHVRGSNNDGVWNMTGIQLPLSITPPFWQTTWFQLMMLILLTSTIISGFQIRMYQIRKAEQRLAAEREIQLKLDHQQRELITKSMDLIEKQDVFKDVIVQLKSIEVMTFEERSKVIRPLIRHLKEIASINHVWGEFEKWFSEIHTGFINNLRQDYPELTSREIKVCALLRLNLLSREIAALINVEPASVYIYRNRIRSKLRLKKSDDLLEFLNKY